MWILVVSRTNATLQCSFSGYTRSGPLGFPSLWESLNSTVSLKLPMTILSLRSFALCVLHCGLTRKCKE